LYSANDRRTGVEKRLRHIGSEATIRPGYEYNLAFHSSAPAEVENVQASSRFELSRLNASLILQSGKSDAKRM
jgi:hypothetical protein